jgi:N-methylhydantoinase B
MDFFMLELHRLGHESGGFGRDQGGLGAEKVMEVRAQEITVSSFMDLHESSAWGLLGGRERRPGKLRVRRNGEKEWRSFSDAFGSTSSNKFANIQLHEGDEIMHVSPSGVGYGFSTKRDSEAIREDVIDGIISEETAKTINGVVLERTK